MTTEKQFELFRKEIYYWLDKFGIKEWTIEVCHSILSEDIVIAECEFSHTNRWVTFSFNKKYELDNLIDERIKESALHEVLELLICDYRYIRDNLLDKDSYMSINIENGARHSLIKRLTNVLLEHIPLIGLELHKGKI